MKIYFNSITEARIVGGLLKNVGYIVDIEIDEDFPTAGLITLWAVSPQDQKELELRDEMCRDW